MSRHNDHMLQYDQEARQMKENAKQNKYRYNRQYEKENTYRYLLILNHNTDRDVIELLQNTDNKRQLIIQALKAYKGI